MTYDELMFIIAEAALSGYNTGAKDAQKAYEGGVIENLKRNGIVDTGMVNHNLRGDKVNFIKVGDKAKVIAEQKWIALFGQGTEAYHEYRRTGFPSEINPAAASVYPGLGIPLRFPYPVVEASTNASNLAVAAQGIQREMFG